MINWISVKERLPPNFVSVLVSWRHLSSGAVTVREGYYYTEENAWQVSRTNVKRLPYVAEFWAFMPPPPNGG